MVLGVVVLTIAMVSSHTAHTAMTLAAALLGTPLGLAGLLLGPYAATRYSMPELADPSEHLAHLSVGVLAVWAWLNRAVGT